MRYKEFKETSDNPWGHLISKAFDSKDIFSADLDDIKDKILNKNSDSKPDKPNDKKLDNKIKASPSNDPNEIRRTEVDALIKKFNDPSPKSQTTPPTTSQNYRPVQGKVSSPFGSKRGNRTHQGVDIGVTSGTKIKSPITGKVIRAVMDNTGCGGTIIISDGTFQHKFCHCSKINVSAGQNVKQGDVVGLTGGGDTDIGKGNARGQHLHWEKRILATGVDVDPMD